MIALENTFSMRWLFQGLSGARRLTLRARAQLQSLGLFFGLKGVVATCPEGSRYGARSRCGLGSWVTSGGSLGSTGLLPFLSSVLTRP